MAYTRPTSTAADASWNGASAYTRPSSSSADVTFVPIGANTQTSLGIVTQFSTPRVSLIQPATGITSTLFGTPSGTNLQRPTGFTETQFGTPTAIYDQFCDATGMASTQIPTPVGIRVQPVTGVIAQASFGTAAGGNYQRPTGFTSTQFGSARLFPFHPAGFNPTTFGLARLFPFHVAPGFGPALFGVPVGTQHWDADSWTAVTRFGTPTTPTDRTAQASGFRPVRLGTPVSIRYMPPSLLQAERASGFGLAMLGTPSAGWLQAIQATGFLTGGVGAQRSVAVQGASGFVIAVLGTPGTWLTQRGAGFAPATFGAPSARYILPATGLTRPTRFGLPTTERSNTYRTYGITMSGRFGRPSGKTRINHTTSGFLNTGLGAPTCSVNHLSLPANTSSNFGRPLLRRNLICPHVLKATGDQMSRLGYPRLRIVQAAYGLNETQFGLPAT